MAPEPSLRPKSRACARLASARACGRRTANEVAFSVARETARMTFARSHALRVPENGIWNRGGQPRACRCRGNYFCAAPFRTHAVRNAGLCAGQKPHRARRDSQYHFSTHPKDASTRMSFLLFRVRSKNATAFAVRRFGTIGARRMEKCRFAIHWRKNLHFLAERKVPKLLCYFLSYKKVKAVSLFREASMFSAYEKQKPQ